MQSLPIDSFTDTIVARLSERGACVVVADPGAGKTTRIPPAILASGMLSGEHGQLVMLQPRRVAARAAAARIAEERGWTLGIEAGYHVRFDKKLAPDTKLRVLTEGLLTRQLVADPFLDRIGCVVLDEFHERSLDVELAFALLREIRATVRPDLKILVMSATIDAEAVANALGDGVHPAPIVRVPGRVFPVDVEYRPASGLKLAERVAEECRAALDMSRIAMDSSRAVIDSSDGSIQHPPGDVLAFLPGAGEIRAAGELLEGWAQRTGVEVVELHGSLGFEEQQRALRRTDGPRVILATNIAETSLTIDGVRTVIDSGFARVPRFDERRGLDRLELRRISAANAEQRRGRAGRTAAGRCIRLWTPSEQARLDAFVEPEIRRVDLASTVLALRAWGQNDPRRFGWFESPGETRLAEAERVLGLLGLIERIEADAADDPDVRSDWGAITAVGRAVERLPVHPRIGRMLVAGVRVGLLQEACGFAAVLSERDFVRDEGFGMGGARGPRTVGSSDLVWRLELLDDPRPPGFVDRFAWQTVRRVRDELLRLARRIDARELPAERWPTGLSAGEMMLCLPLVAFPDRVCRRRGHDAGTMVGGSGVRIDAGSVVRDGEYFLALDARDEARVRREGNVVKGAEAVVRIASRVEREWIEAMLPDAVGDEVRLEFDRETGRVNEKRVRTFLGLTLREVSGPARDAERAGTCLADALAGEAEAMLSGDESAAGLVARIRFARRVAPKEAWPEIEAADVLRAACAGCVSRGEIRLEESIRNRLVYPLDRLLEQLAPEVMEVPTGSKIKLDYSGQSVVMAVRLQEMFGVAETPRVGGGRVAVVMHLLGPNYRAVQVTDDLGSFWKNTYPQVRKDLRARYPRHSWPDDPLTAVAIRGAKRRGT